MLYSAEVGVMAGAEEELKHHVKSRQNRVLVWARVPERLAEDDIQVSCSWLHRQALFFCSALC